MTRPCSEFEALKTRYPTCSSSPSNADDGPAKAVIPSELALPAVGQGVSHMGGQDFRFPTPGCKHCYLALADFMAALRKESYPSSCPYPVNTTILRWLPDALGTKHWKWDPLNADVIDLAIVTFFFLLLPAECLKGDSDPEATRSQAFRIRDVQFDLGGTIYVAHLAPLNDEAAAQRLRHAWLTFSDQKNAVRGELAGHKAVSDPFFGAVKALGRIAHRARRLNAPPGTPIANHYQPLNEKW